MYLYMYLHVSACIYVHMYLHVSNGYLCRTDTVIISNLVFYTICLCYIVACGCQWLQTDKQHEFTRT